MAVDREIYLILINYTPHRFYQKNILIFTSQHNNPNKKKLIINFIFITQSLGERLICHKIKNFLILV